MHSGKMTRRNLLKLGTTATLAFTALGVAACGAPAATPAAEQKPADKPAEAKPAASGGQVTLQHWYHQYGEKGTEEAVLKYAKEYEAANAGVKVVVTWNPGDYNSKLFSALAGGQGPDVYETMPNVAMVKANQCAALDDILKEAKDDFDKKDLTACTIAGKVYGIKMIDDTGALYMRKSVLEKAGVKAPTTFDELVAAAKTLTAGKQKGLFLGNDGGVSALVTLGLQSAGGTLIDESGPKFNTEHTIFAWEQIAKLNKEGSLLIGAPTDWWDPSAFVQGLTAMQWGGLWAYPEINKQLKDDFIVAPFPEFKGVAGAKSTPVTFWGGWSQLANGQSKSLDAAKALIKWMWIDNTKIQTDWALAYGFHVPPRLSVAKTAEPLKEGRTKQIVDDMYKYGQANPPIWTTAMGTAVTNGLSNVVKSGKSAKEEVAAALKICETEFAAQK